MMHVRVRPEAIRADISQHPPIHERADARVRFGMIGADLSCGVCLGNYKDFLGGLRWDKDPGSRRSVETQGPRCGGRFMLPITAPTSSALDRRGFGLEWPSNRVLSCSNFGSNSFFAICEYHKTQGVGNSRPRPVH